MLIQARMHVLSLMWSRHEAYMKRDVIPHLLEMKAKDEENRRMKETSMENMLWKVRA